MICLIIVEPKACIINLINNLTLKLVKPCLFKGLKTNKIINIHYNFSFRTCIQKFDDY